VYASRQLAKRQLTWLSATADLQMVDCLAADATRQVREAIERQLECNR
jgi:tRNA dimethylallyltransferase